MTYYVEIKKGRIVEETFPARLELGDYSINIMDNEGISIFRLDYTLTNKKNAISEMTYMIGIALGKSNLNFMKKLTVIICRYESSNRINK